MIFTSHARQTQRIGRDFERAFERVAVVGGDDRLEALLLGRQLVEIGAFLGIGGVHRIELRLRVGDMRHAFLDAFAHGLFRIELRFLREIADLDARLRPRLAVVLGIDAGHDAQHGRFARTIHAEQADLGAGEKATARCP